MRQHLFRSSDTAPVSWLVMDLRLLRYFVADPVGAVVRTDDPLAGRDAVHVNDLAGRRWFQLPDGTDPVWRAYWNGARPAGELRGGGPVVRTVHECLQAVLWSGTIGLMPLVHALPEGLTSVPLLDMPPSRLVVAWNEADTKPLVRSFVHIAEARYGRSPS